MKNYSKAIIILIVFITIISVIEIITAIRCISLYKGIYAIYYFIPLFIFQLIWCYKVFRNKELNKYKMFAVCIIAILGISALFLLRPNYTYTKGKSIVINKYLENSEFINTQNSTTIPISEGEKNVLIKDRYYYYKIKTNKKTEYIALNPINGNMIELNEDFYIK